MYFFYLGYGRPVPMGWVTRLAEQHKFVHIALEPNDGLHAVKDDDYLRQLADDLAQSGAKVFLRFASEMNGDWTVYHGNPRLYREKFRLVASVMRKRAPNVAMVWCPFGGPLAWSCTRCTNAYYPGDDVVDWVGVNIYNVVHHDNNPHRNATNERPRDLLSYVYRNYAVHKPIMICEYGVTHHSATQNSDCPDYAIDKINSLYGDLPTKFPRVKCINYFDGNNMSFVDTRPYNDYCVTNDPQVLAAYSKAISSKYYLAGEEEE